MRTLKSSVAAIAKHNSALIQVDTSQMQMIANKIQRVMQQHTDVLKHMLTPAQWTGLWIGFTTSIYSRR